ncbi:MAG: chorismate synthase, partial [Treponema porcinum]|nr:chorismate synthase [Treponema porcinum]
TELQIKGRHDVCLCPRIVPVIEAMTDIVLADMLLRN